MAQVKIKDGDIVVETTLMKLSDEIGNQYILGSSENDLPYLAAIALECYEDRDTVSTMMEFIRNSREFDHLTAQECNEIESMLEGGPE